VAVRSEGKKSVRNNPVSSKVRTEGEGGGAPGAGAEILLQPVEDLMPSRWICPEGIAPMQGQRESARRKQQQRAAVVD